jgi:hypothetical protein
MASIRRHLSTVAIIDDCLPQFIRGTCKALADTQVMQPSHEALKRRFISGGGYYLSIPEGESTMRRVLAVLCSFALSCASLASDQGAAKANPLPGADRNDCFPIRFSKDRRVLDDQRLLVWAVGDTPYLVELDRPLQYLSSGGHSITFVDGDGDGRVCRTLRDRIVVADTILSKSRKIVAVTRLNAAQIHTLEAKYETSLARKKRGQWGEKSERDAQSAS